MTILKQRLKHLINQTPNARKLYDSYSQLAQLTRNLRAHGISTMGAQPLEITKSADVLGLIRKLMPQDCGKALIRIGGSGDGGYLIPDDLEGIEYCFSPGVNTISNFENDLANLNIASFLADYSVDSPPVARPEFVFDKKFLGSTNHGRFITLASWKDKYLKDYAGDLILQMDIEGSEYEVIMNTPDDLLDQFRIMVIEFHALDKLFDPFVFGLFSSCFEKLLEHFYVAHIHPNNYPGGGKIGAHPGSLKIGDIEVPRLLEFTFYNKKRVSCTKPQRVFPHKLDEPNVPGRPLCLPECWYSER